jgi:cyclopropane fatty-acyl-phospholipid synthase-like methyltransferase
MVKMESADSSIDNELVQEFWRKRAELEDNRWTPMPYLEFEIEKVQEFLSDDKELSILDLGSGSGSLSRHLTKQNDILTAVDFESSFERFFLQDPRYNFIHCEVDKFISLQKYDLILLFGVVTHLNVQAEDVTYKNIKAMLNHDGLVVVKNQCSVSEEFIFNGFSKELDTNYSARYPNSFEQRDRLLTQFDQVEILEYPSWSKKYPNSAHFMFICRKSRSH